MTLAQDGECIESAPKYIATKLNQDLLVWFHVQPLRKWRRSIAGGRSTAKPLGFGCCCVCEAVEGFEAVRVRSGNRLPV
jgi:hypothetical protein